MTRATMKREAKRAAARKRGVSGKDAAAGEREDPPSSISRVTLSTEDGSVTLIPVHERDWPVCVIGLELLQDAVKKAHKALAAIACDAPHVKRREGECATLLERFKEAGPLIRLGVPLGMIATLKVGLALEYDQTKKLAEEQEDLRLDPEETETRIKQLDRLMSELDVAAMAGTE